MWSYWSIYFFHNHTDFDYCSKIAACYCLLFPFVRRKFAVKIFLFFQKFCLDSSSAKSVDLPKGMKMITPSRRITPTPITQQSSTPKTQPAFKTLSTKAESSPSSQEGPFGSQCFASHPSQSSGQSLEEERRLLR